MTNVLDAFDEFEVRPEFWFGDHVMFSPDNNSSKKSGIIRGLEYVEAKIPGEEINRVKTWSTWRYAVEFSIGRLWIDNDVLIKNGNEPTMHQPRH